MIIDGAHLLRRANDTVGELSELHRASSLEPNKKDLLRDLADLLPRFGRYDEGLDAWRRAAGSERAEQILSRLKGQQGAVRWAAVTREDALLNLQTLHQNVGTINVQPMR